MKDFIRLVYTRTCLPLTIKEQKKIEIKEQVKAPISTAKGYETGKSMG